MATTARAGINGWRVASNATAQARAGVGGWYVVKAAAGTSLPTLSIPSYVPGSLTTTGFRPRVSYTF